MRHLFGLMLVMLLAGPVHAQLVSGSGGGSAPASGGPGVQDQADNVTDTFAGLTFKVQRLVNDPNQQNGIRLIMRVTETEKSGRRIALIQPAATLIDEMGNIYYVAASTGVPICNSGNKSWNLDVGNCAYYAKNTPVTLTPSQPTPVVFLLLPYQESFAPDLAALAQTGSLNARFGIYSADLQTQNFYDVVINGIALPQGGS